MSGAHAAAGDTTDAADAAGEGAAPAAVFDLRTCVLGGGAWAGAAAGAGAGPGLGGWTLAGVIAVLLLAWWTRRHSRLLATALVLAAVLAGATALRVDAAAQGAVGRLAAQRAVVTAEVVVRSDPVTRRGRFGDVVIVRVQTRTVAGRGDVVATSAPVLVLADERWRDVRWGSVVRTTGRLGPADGPPEAAVLTGPSPPALVAPPARLWRAAAAVRVAVREAAAGSPGEAPALVPALVTGDDQALSEDTVEEFRTAGLTHLTAVSGTNLTLVLVALLGLARLAGCRGRWLVAAGLVGVAGFVLVARPEPSVVRAAAMGTVALLALGGGGRPAAARALGAAVLVLVLFDPWLARSVGFALSVLATGGLIWVAPPCRDALARWLPGWAAEAVAVPLAAQLASTPLVAALSGQVSLVAVAANLVAAPAVAPATVLGLAGGLVGLLVPPGGAALGWVAGVSAQGIVLTADVAASLPVAAVSWPVTPAGLLALTLATAAAVAVAPRVLRRPWLAAGCTAALVVVVALPRPGWLAGAAGWPPPGWVLVMCDVGQGDALVLATGRREAVVIDTGPDPRLVDGCLSRLGVTRVPAVVLTHFDADHVDGLPGVLDGRAVGEVQVSPLREPAEGAAQVDRQATAAGVPTRVPSYGEQVGVGAVGGVSWRTLAPRRVLPGSSNDASLVLLVEIAGVSLLLSGDVEPASQAPLLRTLAEVGVTRVDVLKVPHHGSRYQDPALLTGLGARLALVSVGEDNTYGHPAPETLDLLEGAGTLVRRTDRDGDVAVVVRDGQVSVVTAGG